MDSIPLIVITGHVPTHLIVPRGRYHWYYKIVYKAQSESGTKAVISPSIRQTMAALPYATNEQVCLAIFAARVAFDSGPPPRERAAGVARLAFQDVGRRSRKQISRRADESIALRTGRLKGREAGTRGPGARNRLA